MLMGLIEAFMTLFFLFLFFFFLQMDPLFPEKEDEDTRHV